MQIVNIKDPNGTVQKCQFCQFEVSPNQQVLVVGCNFELDESYEVSSVDHVVVTRMGNLRGVQFVFSNQVINSCNVEKWDWKKCWDPQLVLLEDTRSYGEIMKERLRKKYVN